MEKTTIKTTEVKLLGETYAIKSGAESERVKELADYLDAKMSEIKAAAPNYAMLKVVILAAFYITEELFECKTQLSATLNTMEEKTANILKMLEDASITFSGQQNGPDDISSSLT
ncbi:cell division protein ZapA [bacterium]|nr:cell division protein ZapA [bacterium]